MATNVYGSRTKVFVTPFVGQTIKYGFATNIDAGDRTALGQVEVDANAGVVVFGCESPKPAKAKKVSTATAAAGSVTSFIDAEKLAAMPAGWIVTRRATARAAASGGRTKAVFVAFSGYKYAWLMPTRLYTNIGTNRTGLGIIDCAANDYREYIWGSNNFKPPRAAKTVDGGAGGIDTYSTYYDPDQTLPTGWVQAKAGYVKG